MNPPNGFHWMSEDRRRAKLDRRADERAERQRRLVDRQRVDSELVQAVLASKPHPTGLHRQILNEKHEQEITADKLRQSGMVVR